MTAHAPLYDAGEIVRRVRILDLSARDLVFHLDRPRKVGSAVRTRCGRPVVAFGVECETIGIAKAWRWGARPCTTCVRGAV